MAVSSNARLKATVTADTRDFDRGMRDASGSLDKFKGSLAGFAAGAIAIGVGVQAFQAVAGGIASATMAASNLGEMISKSGVVFADQQAEMLKWSETTATALGMSQRQALDSANMFGQIGKAAGLTGTELTDFSKTITQSAADLASFNDATPEDTLAAWQSALAGESEPMRKYGVYLSDAALKARALALGISDGTSDLTQQQKTLATYAEVMAQTSDAQGDFARTQSGVANQLRITKAVLDNTKVAFGGAFKPLAERVLPIVNKSLTEVGQSIDKNAETVAEGMTRVGDIIAKYLNMVLPKLTENFNELLANLPERIDSAATQAQRFADAIWNWSVSDDSKVFFDTLKDNLGSIGTLLTATSGLAAEVWNAFSSLPPDVQATLTMLALAQKTGVLQIAVTGVNLIKDVIMKMLGMTITAAVVNVNGPVAGGVPTPGGVPPAGKGLSTPAKVGLTGIQLVPGVTAGLAAGVFMSNPQGTRDALDNGGVTVGRFGNSFNKDEKAKEQEQEQARRKREADEAEARTRSDESNRAWARDVRTRQEAVRAAVAAAWRSAEEIKTAFGSIPEEVSTDFLANIYGAQENAQSILDQYGLTPNQLASLFIAETTGAEGSVERLLAEYGLTPEQWQTIFSTSNVDPSISEAQRVRDALDKVPQYRDVFINVTTQWARQWGDVWNPVLGAWVPGNGGSITSTNGAPVGSLPPVTPTPAVNVSVTQGSRVSVSSGWNRQLVGAR